MWLHVFVLDSTKDTILSLLFLRPYTCPPTSLSYAAWSSLFFCTSNTTPSSCCLQRFLADDGISIPSSYTSFLVPVTSTKLYDSVKAYKDMEHFETPYVVKLHR